jgi:uncharacterized membrane protein
VSAGFRAVTAGIVACAVGTSTATAVVWQAAPLLGWDAGECVFLAWVWWSIAGLDAADTARHAVREDPTVGTADAVIVGAGVACLGAVGLVLIKAAGSAGAAKALLIGLGVLSVAFSWASVHTIFTLRYARNFYGRGAGGIDFNQDEKPDYLDFAYVAFTIGLTFQVSDTDLTTRHMRRLALRHALLSFLFGAVIVGLTINVVASLLR